MDIGTAKPTASELAQVRHHGIDLCSPEDFYSAGEYGQFARDAIRSVFERKSIPVVVGGSGLYIQAIVEGIFSGEHRDEEIRDRLKKQAHDLGLEKLFQQLQEIDPEYAEKIHPNDAKRIIRALEVYQITGIPFSQCHREKTEGADFQVQYWGLRWPREQLVDRIHRRVDQMVEQGLVDEVRSLLEAGFSPELNSLNSVGYQEIIAFLRNQLSLAEAVELIKRNTRRFSKRQMTWFRRIPAIQWVECDGEMNWAPIARKIADAYAFPFEMKR